MPFLMDKGERKMKKLVWVVAIALLLSACSKGEAKKEQNNDAKTITIGATAGPYSDQLKEGIAPLLKEEGYELKVVEFHDYIQPNNALEEGDIDANLYQNRLYLTNFNKEKGTHLHYLFAVPSAPIALYSTTHQSLDDVKEGMTITLPNDTVNLARSLNMLQNYGWITVNPDIDHVTVSEKDITENPLNLVIKPLDAAATARSLDDADFAFVNGNYAIASGLKFTEAVDVEQTSEDFLIYLAIREGDENEDFVKALQKVYESDAFYEYTKEHAKGYVLPPYQQEREAK